MEKKYQLLIFALGLVLSLSLVDAISLSVPSEVDLNENFDIVISDSGSGFYIVEMNIPSSFDIVSDSSNGERTGDIYKTAALGSLTIRLRGIQEGLYTISGIHGNGLETGNLVPQTIRVSEIQATLSCPVCPSSTLWSNCENNKQVKLFYSCSSLTNYQCIKSSVTRLCNIEVSQGGVISNVQEEICDVGWMCKDENTLAYQSSDCSLSSVQSCTEGCANNQCNVNEETKKQIEESLTVEVLPAGTHEGAEQNPSNSIFSSIGNFIRNIIDFLMFWN